ncbi:ROK family transcriptional regulator [Nocardia sp. NPDC051463]|uniref:ROK family transcriptional regulator n=1 Tax=Nocardia sp. NPDC051463 TaxID=3154845 RepID=UPI00344DEFEA
MSSETTTDLRQANLSRALQAVQIAGSLTRSELTKQLGISRNTAAQIVSDLVEFGLLVESAASPSGRRGRPTTELRLGQQLPGVVVAEVTPEEVRVATVLLGRRVEQLQRVDLADRSAREALIWIADQARIRLQELGAASQGVAVSIYGLVDADGMVRNAPNIGWHDIEVTGFLRDALPQGTPIFTANDASMSALHEARYGAGRGADSMLYLYSADGVGGGLVVHGELVQGRRGYAGEIGHMLINPGGALCRCGRRGCWETEVDQRALRRRGRAPASLGDQAAAEYVLTAAQAGSETAQHAVAETAIWFGEGLGSLLNILDPDVVVLGGLFRRLWEMASEQVCAVATARSLDAPGDLANHVACSDQANSSLLGAAEHLMGPLLARPGMIRGQTIPS